LIGSSAPCGAGQLCNRGGDLGRSGKDKSPEGAFATGRNGLELDGSESRRETTFSLSGYCVVLNPIPRRCFLASRRVRKGPRPTGLDPVFPTFGLRPVSGRGDLKKKSRLFPVISRPGIGVARCRAGMRMVGPRRDPFKSKLGAFSVHENPEPDVVRLRPIRRNAVLVSA
jgi:hypothetical protein